MVRHVGFLSKQRDIGTLADALIAVDRLIEEHSLTVEFVGDVRAQAEEIRKVKSAGLRNVHVKSLGVVSPAEAADLIATADAGLLVEEEADVGVFLPSKFCDYVACGCPVIAIGNKDSAVGDLIQEFACGVLIEHGDVSGCVAGLLGVMKRQWTASDEAAAYFGPARVGAAWDLLIRRTVQVCLPWARLRNTA
jgi:glycosyltransferase involved in cell wall biosynthesis